MKCILVYIGPVEFLVNDISWTFKQVLSCLFRNTMEPLCFHYICYILSYVKFGIVLCAPQSTTIEYLNDTKYFIILCLLNCLTPCLTCEDFVIFIFDLNFYYRRTSSGCTCMRMCVCARAKKSHVVY